jgi:hypothetical protein
MVLKNIFAKNLAKNMAFFIQNKTNYAKIGHNIAF